MADLINYNTKITSYPNGYREIIHKKSGMVKMKEGFTMTDKEVEARIAAAQRPVTQSEQEERTAKQEFRIKRKIRQLILANPFDYFCTLTLNPEKVNSLDYEASKKRLLTWCKNQRDRKGRFDWLFVPEFHKSGRVHFHGVIGNSQLNFSEAANQKTGKSVIRQGRQVYNLLDWKNGFSDCERIENKDKTASYMTKYITKELMSNPNMANKPRYFRSQGLIEPEMTFTDTDDEQYSGFVPSFGLVDLDENGDSFLDLAIYKQEIDKATGEIIDLSGNSLIRLKNCDTKTPPSETFDGSDDGFAL